MTLAEPAKLCIYCGENVTHRRRHKNRNGQYECMVCYWQRRPARRHRWRRLWGRARKRLRENKWLRRGILYLIVAPIGLWIFYQVMVWLIEHALTFAQD